MFIDPFDTLLDFQLRSMQGRLEEITVLGCFPQTSIISNMTADMLADAFDKKYHQPELWKGEKALATIYYKEGYSQVQIAGILGISQQSISKMLREGK